jgi:hypothetical protein
MQGKIPIVRRRTPRLARVARASFLVALLLTSQPAVAQTGDGAADNEPGTLRVGNATLKFSGSLTLVAFYENPMSWGIRSVFIPGYVNKFTWGEGALKFNVQAEQDLNSSLKFYGGASMLASFTLGEDPYETKNVLYAGYDDLYIGLKTQRAADGWNGDLSFGAQRFVAGTGLLLGDGAPEGNARGAISFGPYEAWQTTVIGRLSNGSTEISAFYLDPNEIYTPDTDTQIVGANFEYLMANNGFSGIYGGTVINSNAPYPQALPDQQGSILIPDGRDGMSFVNGYFRWQPDSSINTDYWLSGDLAYEWSNRIAMKAWGARFGAGAKFNAVPMTPTIGYNFQTLSGDDPSTPQLERFDPLFGGLSGDYWQIGSNSSLVFANSNINVHRFSIAANLSDHEQLAIKYFIISTNQLDSPLTLENEPSGGATNPFPQINASGSKRLADEIGIQYTRLVGPNSVVNFAVNYSMPKAALNDFAGRPVEDWLGLVVGCVLSF